MTVPDSLLAWLVIAAALGSGLVGGLLFGFSVAVMPALSRQSDSCGIAVMQAINVVILTPLFLLLFMGTAAVSVALIGAAAGISEGPRLLVLGGALCYLVGVVGITMTINVPLNNRLAPLDATARESWPSWRAYLRRWTWWNHVRSLAGVLASIALTLAAARLP
jgi:uncharacterized membrane protein